MKKVKLKDVAAAAGVSLTTASRVVNDNGYVSEEVRRAVADAIEATGYEIPKKSTSQTGKKLIGVILKRLSANMFFELQNEAYLQEARRRGMQTITSYCEVLDSKALREEAEYLLSYQICGLIISGFQERRLSPELKAYLLSLPIPVVFVERLADSHGLNQVCVDNYLGGYLAGKHLLERGHRRIVYIGRAHLDTDSGSRRMNGFLKAMQEAETTPEYQVIECNSPNMDEGYAALQKVEQIFPGYTAVQVWHDPYAVGVLRYLYEKQIRVPDEVEVIGHDDTYSSLMTPPISTVRLPMAEMAQAAVRIVVDWMDESVEHYVQIVNLEPKLVLRGV